MKMSDLVRRGRTRQGSVWLNCRWHRWPLIICRDQKVRTASVEGRSLTDSQSSNILSVRSQQSLLLSILVALDNLIDVLQNLLFPSDGLLLILKSLFFASRLDSLGRLLGPHLVILAADQLLLLFFCEPWVVAVAENEGILTRISGHECARNVGVIEKRVPE